MSRVLGGEPGGGTGPGVQGGGAVSAGLPPEGPLSAGGRRADHHEAAAAQGLLRRLPG